MVFMIGAAQRRFLVFASTIFFVSSLYICISRLMAPTFKPIPVRPKEPEIHVEFSKADLPMSYGNFGRPAYDSINMLAQFPDELIPTKENGRRLIVVGDIHGMLDSLNELLKRTKFDPTRDHLISVGDTVNKGPKSAEVVQRLMELGASAVRGNHEDRVLVAWAGLSEQQGVEAYLDSDFAAAQRGESLDLKTARSLSEPQIQWLKNLPVILTIEPMSLYIVHAGLVPGVPLANQDPWAVMNMRSMRFPHSPADSHADSPPDSPADSHIESHTDSHIGISGSAAPESSSELDLLSQPDHDIWIPVDSRSGEPWANIWNLVQKKIPSSQRRSIIYGHDAKRGFQEDSYTFGLDSGCVKGNAMTALIIEAESGGWNQTTLQLQQHLHHNNWHVLKIKGYAFP
ncbi:Metallo-dependent phosphatase-like protein [Ilyonectria destructans]|nr:Metallo-dependent phosphatase-like protein [Ilyonectria destructans]